MLQQVGLTGGAAWIRPQQDVTYYVDANSGATDLTVRDGPADRFYLAVFSGQAAIGINVKTEAAVNRGFLVGFGYGNDSVIEMRRRGASGGYYPVGPIRRAEFRATRAGSAQTITGGADTVMAWTEEDFDLGGFFNLAGNAWVPPAGRVDLDAQIAVTNGEVGGALTIDILKNGTSVARGYVRGQDTFTARAVLRDLFDCAHILFADHRDIGVVLGGEFGQDDAQARVDAAAAQAFAAFPRLRYMACTQRTAHNVDQHSLGALLLGRDGTRAVAPEEQLVGIVDRIGGGDAFAAGVLHGLIEGFDADSTIRFGLAAGCLKHSIPGDFNRVGVADVQALVGEGRFDVRR